MTISPVHTMTPRALPGMQPLERIEQPDGSFSVTKAKPTEEAPGAKFSNILERAVSEVDARLHAADVEKTKLLTGETTNVHQAMIAMQEASVAFSLMVEVRNKLVESYQELMRMQV